jgi:hypothetical protein
MMSFAETERHDRKGWGHQQKACQAGRLGMTFNFSPLL